MVDLKYIEIKRNTVELGNLLFCGYKDKETESVKQCLRLFSATAEVT